MARFVSTGYGSHTQVPHKDLFILNEEGFLPFGPLVPFLSARQDILDVFATRAGGVMQLGCFSASD